LNQDPGGADKKALLEERRNRPIIAGIVGQRTAHPDAQWFGEASLGLFLHWGISSAHGGIDLSWPMMTNMGTGLKIKPADYWKLDEQFKAEHFDPNLWLKAAKDAGFDYAVLTAKHHDGYTLWPTEASEQVFGVGGSVEAGLRARSAPRRRFRPADGRSPGLLPGAR
jgi:hypothetical protein